MLFSDTERGVVYGPDLTKHLARIMNLTKDNENITQTMTRILLNNPTENKKKKKATLHMCYFIYVCLHILKVLQLL